MNSSTEDHHQIIHDHDQVRAFLSKYIPLESETDLSISLMLIARRKYCPSLPKSEYNLGRTFIAGGSTVEAATRKLWRYHVPVGCYVDSDEKTIPNKALCVYAVIKPKNTMKALSTTTKECMDALVEGKVKNDPYHLFGINIAKSDTSSPSERYKYTQIDLDTKEVKDVQLTCKLLQECNVSIRIISITETRGGFHIVYRKDRDIAGTNINHRRLNDFKTETAFNKSSHDGSTVTDYWFSQTNQPIVIIPGTIQGGYPATAWSVKEFYLHYGVSPISRRERDMYGPRSIF